MCFIRPVSLSFVPFHSVLWNRHHPEKWWQEPLSLFLCCGNSMNISEYRCSVCNKKPQQSKKWRTNTTAIQQLCLKGKHLLWVISKKYHPFVLVIQCLELQWSCAGFLRAWSGAAQWGSLSLLSLLSYFVDVERKYQLINLENASHNASWKGNCGSYF